MNIALQKLKILAVVLGIPWLLISGCIAGLVGDNGAKHISDNNTMVRQQQIAADERMAAERAAAKLAAAQAQADAKMHQSSERTQQTLLVQNASSERLLIQSQHLIAVREAGTQRFNAFLITVVILSIIGGGGFLVIYLRNHPRPVAYQMLPLRPQHGTLPQSRTALPQSTETAIQTAQAVPYSVFVGDPRFVAHGWQVKDPQTGIRIINGQIVQQCQLLEG